MVKGKFYLPLQFSEYYQHDFEQNFFQPFILLTKDLIDKKQSHFAWVFYFIFLRKTSQTKLERLSMANFDFSEKTRKIVSNKTNICSNFRLKLCQKPWTYKNCQTNQI